MVGCKKGNQHVVALLSKNTSVTDLKKGFNLGDKQKYKSRIWTFTNLTCWKFDECA